MLIYFPNTKHFNCKFWIFQSFHICLYFRLLKSIDENQIDAWWNCRCACMYICILTWVSFSLFFPMFLFFLHFYCPFFCFSFFCLSFFWFSFFYFPFVPIFPLFLFFHLLYFLTSLCFFLSNFHFLILLDVNFLCF